MNHLVKRFDITYKLGDLLPPKVRLTVRNLLFRRGTVLKMEPTDRQFLIDYYREDILKLNRC